MKEKLEKKKYTEEKTWGRTPLHWAERELVQVAQGGDGVSLSGGIKHPPGQVSVLPALDGPALAGRLDWISPEVTSNSKDSVILWYSGLRRLANLRIP